MSTLASSDSKVATLPSTGIRLCYKLAPLYWQEYLAGIALCSSIDSIALSVESINRKLLSHERDRCTRSCLCEEAQAGSL